MNLNIYAACPPQRSGAPRRLKTAKYNSQRPQSSEYQLCQNQSHHSHFEQQQATITRDTGIDASVLCGRLPGWSFTGFHGVQARKARFSSPDPNLRVIPECASGAADQISIGRSALDTPSLEDHRIFVIVSIDIVLCRRCV
jgi:hypothetical protein